MEGGRCDRADGPSRRCHSRDHWRHIGMTTSSCMVCIHCVPKRTSIMAKNMRSCVVWPVPIHHGGSLRR